jgi:type IV pilus assembly protein PilN
MIHVPVNLASEPFRRDRPLLVGSVVVAIALIVTLFIQIGLILSERAEAADTRFALERVNTQVTRLGAQQAALDATLRKPENAEVLERSIFLNDIIQHKAISWTKVFADLDKVMPYNVRLVSVRLPQVDSQNRVLMDMVVGADDPAPILQFMDKLEKSPQFSPVRLATQIPPSQTDKLWKFRISVDYAQKL